MSSVIELESSYCLKDNYDYIMKKIEQEEFKLKNTIVEEDTYFTDKDLVYIKDRICLRTRKINEDFLELTYKPRTDDNTEKYGKKEVNLKIDVKDYIDTKYVLKSLGYIEYVSFKKYRETYTKLIDGFEYNIMIDKIKDVGTFIELEILANNDEEKEILHDKLDEFIKIIGCENLEEKKKPYRDIVKEYYENINR